MVKDSDKNSFCQIFDESAAIHQILPYQNFALYGMLNIYYNFA